MSFNNPLQTLFLRTGYVLGWLLYFNDLSRFTPADNDTSPEYSLRKLHDIPFKLENLKIDFTYPSEPSDDYQVSVIVFSGMSNKRRIGMASYMIVRHKVQDYSKWKLGYDAHRSKRIEAGLTEKHLLRGSDDPNEVIALFEAEDLNRAKAFAESKDLRETMQKVGVIDKPDIYFLNG
jgi:hypothetical protein